jgi:hypothetical protein
MQRRACTRNRMLATSAAAVGALLLLQHSPSGLDGDDGRTIPITRLVSRVPSWPQLPVHIVTKGSTFR